MATVLVQGTLKIGDFIVCGLTWCKVRAMTDFRGRRVDLAYPSMPVEITGWSDVPEVGEKVLVTDEKIAKEIAGLRLNEKKLEDQKASSRISLDDFYKQMQNTGIKELNLIIKGDVGGSIEALAQSLLRLSTNEVKVNVIHSAVGAVTETDVMLASASNAIIIGFNVRPDIKARKYGEEENIDIRMYRVIYEAIDDVKRPWKVCSNLNTGRNTWAGPRCGRHSRCPWLGPLPVPISSMARCRGTRISGCCAIR